MYIIADQLITAPKIQKRQIKKVGCKYFFNYFLSAILSWSGNYDYFLSRFSYRHKPWGMWVKCGENGLVILGENVGEFLGENKHKKTWGNSSPRSFKFIGENVGEITAIQSLSFAVLTPKFRLVILVCHNIQSLLSLL